MIKVLNLYACLGGNRYKWDEVADIQVTAVELDGELARLYQERFPNDTVIVADAHQYLLDHYQEFDFIWSSPPCPTHSRARFWFSSNYDTNLNPVYPDMMLYQEILFLQHFYKGKYVVENVVPYYKPLISAYKRNRHLYWTNFKIPNEISKRKFEGFYQRTIKSKYPGNELNDLCIWHEIDLSTYDGKQKKIKIARNLVDYVAGKTIFQEAVRIINNAPLAQIGLFQ